MMIEKEKIKARKSRKRVYFSEVMIYNISVRR